MSEIDTISKPATIPPSSTVDRFAFESRIIDLKNKMHILYAERSGTAVERFVEILDRDLTCNEEYK
ncbi:MAG: hypothetical protein H7177_14670 [Rhizobacter sp.]|nr:hypothetical protein [Bacteriovorax sp.]